MRTDDFIAHVAAHAGVSARTAETATLSVLAGIAGHLTREHQELVAEELPPALGAALLDAENLTVPLVPNRSIGYARELIASVCRVLVERMSIDAVAILRAKVPAIATYLAVPAPGQWNPMIDSSEERIRSMVSG